MDSALGPVATAYLDAVRTQIESDLGTSLGPGTTIVAADDRAGTATAVAYDLVDRTAIWCDPRLTGQLRPLAGPDTLDIDHFIARSEQLGAELRGVGENRVLESGTEVPEFDLGPCRPVWLDRDDPTDLELLAGLRRALSDDDADEAEFDLDDLDPVILGLVVDDDHGAPILVAQAGSRPWQQGDGLADIGVTVHPDHRRRGLGVAVVGRFARERAGSDELLMYRYDVDNAGSRALAEAVGFTIVHRVAAMRFPDAPDDTD